MVVLIGIILFIAFMLIIRLFGAWMLRIDEVIKLQKEMLAEMKKHFQQKLSLRKFPHLILFLFLK
jgi:hypothetical protein